MYIKNNISYYLFIYLLFIYLFIRIFFKLKKKKINAQTQTLPFCKFLQFCRLETGQFMSVTVAGVIQQDINNSIQLGATRLQTTSWMESEQYVYICLAEMDSGSEGHKIQNFRVSVKREFERRFCHESFYAKTFTNDC